MGSEKRKPRSNKQSTISHGESICQEILGQEILGQEILGKEILCQEIRWLGRIGFQCQEEWEQIFGKEIVGQEILCQKIFVVKCLEMSFSRPYGVLPVYPCTYFLNTEILVGCYAFSFDLLCGVFHTSYPLVSRFSYTMY